MNIKKKLCSIIGHKKTINGFPTTVCPRCGHVFYFVEEDPSIILKKHLDNSRFEAEARRKAHMLRKKMESPGQSTPALPSHIDEQNNTSTQNADQFNNNMILYHMMLHSDTLNDNHNNHTDSNTTHQSDSNSDSYRNDYDSGGSSYDNSSSNDYYDAGSWSWSSDSSSTSSDF